MNIDIKNLTLVYCEQKADGSRKSRWNLNEGMSWPFPKICNFNNLVNKETEIHQFTISLYKLRMIWFDGQKFYQIVVNSISEDKPTREELEDLHCILNENIDKIVQLMPIPRRNPDDRALVISALAEGGADLRSDDEKIDLSATVINEALIMSNTFDLNEIAAVDLLYLGERENFRQYGFTRGLCAVYLFFKRSWYFAEALRAIALNMKGRRWECDRPLATMLLLSEYMTQLLSSGLLLNTLRYITEFDLKGLLLTLEQPDVRGIGDSRHRRMISDVIFDTVAALCDVIFYSACQLSPTYSSIETTLCFLCDIDLKNEQSPEKCSILLSIVFSGLELIDQSEFCDISARRSHLIDWDSVSQVYDCMLAAQRLIRDAQWVDTGLQGVFMLALSSGIRILRRFPSCIGIDERRERLADEEILFFESLKRQPFHYIRQKLLGENVYRDEFFQRRFHVYLIQLLVLFRTKFKDLRMECENVPLNQTAEGKDALHFIQLVLLIKEFYENDPLKLHLGNAYFDFTPTACLTADSEAMENELVRFVRGSAEFLPPILYSDFMDMLNSLAMSKEAAGACFNLLMDFANQGEQMRNCSLTHLFLALQQYSISLEQAIAASGLTEVPISTEIDPVELQCLKRYLYLIAALAERNPVPRSIIFNNKDWNCSVTLINLLGYPLPLEFKHAILAVLEALTKTEEFALSICSAAIEAGLFHSTNGRHSAFLIELLEEDSEKGPFLMNTALLKLIRSSLNHQAFIEETDPTYTIYLSLLMHRIIPKIMTITVKYSSEKIELFNLLIETLYDWMINIGNSLESLRSRALATEVLTSVFTGGQLYNWINDIVEMGFTELDKYEDRIKNKPLLKLLTSALKFCYNIAVKRRQILQDRYHTETVSLEMETVSMLMISGQYRFCENRFICMLIRFLSYCPFHPILSLLAIKILREINFAEFPQWSVLAALASEQDATKVIYSFVACLDIDGVDINQVDPNPKLENLFKKNDAQIRGMVALEMLEFLNDNITFVSRMDPRSGVNTTTIPNCSSIALFLSGFDIRNPESTILEEMGVQGTRKTVLHATLEILASGLDKNKDSLSFGALLEPAYRFCYLLCEVRSSREVFLRFVRSTQDFVFRHFSHFVQFFNSEKGKACSLRMYNCMCYVMKMVSYELEQMLTVEGINDLQRYFEYFFSGDTKWDSVLVSLISNRPLLEESSQWTPPELDHIEMNRVLPLLSTCTTEMSTGYRLCCLPTLMATLEKEVHLYIKPNLYPPVDFAKFISQDLEQITNAVNEYNLIQLQSFIRKEYFTSWQCILERLIIVQQRFDTTFKMPINCILQILETLLTQDFVSLTGKVSKAVFILGAWFRRLKAVQRWTTAEFMDKAIAGNLTEDEVDILPAEEIGYSNNETEPNLLRSLTYIMHLLIRRIESNEVRQSEESQLYYYSMFLLFLHMLPFLSVKNTFPMSHFIPDKILGRAKLAQSEKLPMPDRQYTHSWEIRLASVEALLQFPSAVLKFYADSFSQLLLNDCCDGPTENKMIALSCVTSTISLVYNLRGSLCEASIIGGYVRHHVDALLDEDNAPLNEVLCNAKAIGSPHALHIARLAFLTTIAADKNGAVHLIQLNTFEKLAEMNSYELLFPNLDSDEVDGSGITLGRRCRTVMMAVLQMCSAVLDHFEEGHLVCQQAMLTFLSKHVTMFSWLIDAHNGVVLASLEDLRLLKRLVAVLTPCTRLELLQAVVDNERTAVAKSLSQLLGRLLSCFTEYMTNFESNHDFVDYDTLIVFEDFELHILQIAEELIDFCILHIGVGGYKRKKYSPFLCLPAIPQDCEEIALSVLLIQMLQQCVAYWKTHCAKTPLEKGLDLVSFVFFFHTLHKTFTNCHVQNKFSFGTNLDEIVKRTQLYKEVSLNIHGREMLGNIRSQQLVTLQTLFEKTLFALRCHILSTIYRYANSAQPVNVERGGVVDNGDAASNAEAELLALKSFKSTLRNDLTAALFDSMVQLADFFVASEQSIPAWDIFSKQKFSHGAIQEIRDLVWNFR
ncbi:Nuclear pore complex protein [Trichinella pseudospiralis]|uniref:Nuclear pore complex protein n=1 Tax=Trichinella pseudospiralis TaxID=6337 RepID=A0A0V1IXF6_TRIPS|nr:Nuclear pore complex protein [Trichinella pseudospiralis]KRZ27387.1 Nuclear pore complex protein [Trichinella pseudospiralis]